MLNFGLFKREGGGVTFKKKIVHVCGDQIKSEILWGGGGSRHFILVHFKITSAQALPGKNDKSLIIKIRETYITKRK